MKRLLTMILLSGLFSVCAFAGIIHVPQNQPTIQAGIDAAVNGDTILVADGTYFENVNFKGKEITVASHFLMDEDTTHIDSTIIDGRWHSNPDSGSVVYIISGEDTTSILCGFTITGGTGTIVIPGVVRTGGGILCGNAGAKICHNRIVNNSVTYANESSGGGISAGPPGSTAFVVIENNLIQSNTTISKSDEVATSAGMFLGVNARIVGNRILDNIASAANNQAWGGGLVSQAADSVIATGNTIMRNKALTSSATEEAFGGGMIFLRDTVATIRITGNVIAHNEISSGAFQGGAGVYIERTGNMGGNVLFANNLIYKNKYNGAETCRGGGLRLRHSNVKVFNNTFTGNKASYGGGISSSQSGNSLIMNNIFWGDTATISMTEIDISSGSPPTFVYNDIQGGWTGEGNIDADPQLVADSLTISSPCIGAGILSYNFGGAIVNAPPFDINGRMRPYPADSDPDIGAWESKQDSAVVGIEPQPVAGIPKSYSLGQNYPNPFNPSTIIEFALPKSGFVTLKIYNILGKEAATLVSDRLTAGSYKYEWDASKLASGVYLYRLAADKFIKTRKMVLMR